jgi:alginate O-acetyltransferase complex protein AlgI
MLFTSITFALFLTILFLLYWFIFNRSLSGQNLFLLASSYIFYGWWDWRFAFLLLFISVSNYFIAILLQKTQQKRHRKLFFITGLIINIGTLVFFKYFNFFMDGFIDLASIFGLEASRVSLKIILPIGISFYIFLSISYLIDVYQNKLIASTNITEVLLTLSFFPIILAGPIQRPISLLPQIKSKRVFDAAIAADGLRQILWGLFMKIVIADSCVKYVYDIFLNFTNYSGSTLIVGIFLFTVQIYADFAGYSNIAIGIGKLLGFTLMKNFAFPYFSRDIKEFWRRWNISLTSWFRDYVFLPVAYSVSRNIKSDRFYLIKTDVLIYVIGISVTWILTGLWHGANYTFIIWGAIHGFFLVMHHLTVKPRKKWLKRLNIQNNNSILILFETFVTFLMVMFSLIFFRADTAGQAFSYISGIFSMSSFTIPVIRPKTLLILIVLFSVAEWLGRENEYAIAAFSLKWPKLLRWAMYYGIILAIFVFSGHEQQFIYFKF